MDGKVHLCETATKLRKLVRKHSSSLYNENQSSPNTKQHVTKQTKCEDNVHFLQLLRPNVLRVCKGQRVNHEFYLTTSECLQETVRKKNLKLCKHKWLLNHCNTPKQEVLTVQKFLVRNRIPPYSPDIYSVGLLLFLKWKLQFKMTRTEINTGNTRKHTTAANSYFLEIVCGMMGENGNSDGILVIMQEGNL